MFEDKICLSVAVAREAAERRGPSSGAHGGTLQLLVSGKVEKPCVADVVTVSDTEPEVIPKNMTWVLRVLSYTPELLPSSCSQVVTP